jgi:hypothetical protein
MFHNLHPGNDTPSDTPNISSSAGLITNSQHLEATPKCNTQSPSSYLYHNKIIQLKNHPEYYPTDSNQLWRPSLVLSVAQSDHPFQTNCAINDLIKLHSYCSFSPTDIFVYLQRNKDDYIQIKHLRNLLSPTTPVTQKILNLYLELIQPSIQHNIPGHLFLQ